MSAPAKKTGPARVYRCARCNRKLKAGVDRWLYSRWTNKRYCVPGDRGACLAADGKPKRRRKR